MATAHFAVMIFSIYLLLAITIESNSAQKAKKNVPKKAASKATAATTTTTAPGGTTGGGAAQGGMAGGGAAPSSDANTLVVASPYTSAVTCLSDAGVTGPVDAQLNQPIQNGMFTFYQVSSDYAACGLPTNNPNMSACVSGQLFTSGAQWAPSCFPDKHYMLKDSVCLNKCVKIDYQGKSLTVPINNRCQDFQPNHVDLSEAGFVWLTGNANQGIGKGATITYIKCT